jgi:hypothetical protein
MAIWSQADTTSGGVTMNAEATEIAVWLDEEVQQELVPGTPGPGGW